MTAAHAIPAHWTRRRLRFDATFNPLKSKLDLPLDTEVSFVPMDAIGEFGGLQLDQVRPIEEVYSGYTYFADGDVCIAKITPCFENGKGALAQDLTNGIAFGTTELHVIRPSPALDAQFLFYLTMAHDFRSFGEAEMLGAGGQKRVPEEFLKDWRAPLPPPEVQRRIAHFLEGKTAQIDALIDKKRALLDRLAEKRQALITHAVTKGLNPNAPMKDSGVDWLGKIPAHWEVLPMKRMKRFLTSGSRGWAPYYADEGDVFLRMTNVTKDGVEIDEKDLRYVCLDGANEGTRTALQEGDILITITAELGSVAIARKRHEGAYINQHLALFRCDKELCNADFLVNYLSTSLAREQFTLSGQGGTKQGLGFEQVDGVLLGRPPLPEQAAIAEFLEKIRGRFRPTEMALSQQLKLLAEYRTSLITAAVTGNIAGLQ